MWVHLAKVKCTFSSLVALLFATGVISDLCVSEHFCRFQGLKDFLTLGGGDNYVVFLLFHDS